MLAFMLKSNQKIHLYLVIILQVHSAIIDRVIFVVNIQIMVTKILVD